MTELIDSIRVEPFQIELTVAALVVSAVALVCSLIYGAWKTTTRRPLEFDLFLVEMHTMERRRLVEVLHIGPNYERGLGYTCLISRLRSRANQSAPEDGQFLGISDTNIVIHSPSTVNEPNAQANVVVAERNQLILWDIEMPRSGRTLLNPARDSHVASAAAITVLARPAVRNTTSREGQTVERGSNSVASSSTLVRMQYMPPLRRRPLVHILNYRMPVAVTLARESSQRVLIPQQRQRSTSTPSTHSPPDFDTPRESEQAPSENPAPEMSTSIPPLPTGRGIQIRLKFLDDTQKLVDTDLAATVLQFKHSTFPLEMSQSKVIRLIFRGKLMRDDSLTLEAYGVQDGAVVHCHISSTPYAQAPGSQNAPNQRREQPRTGEHSAEVDRSNVWFFRVILAFLTTQLTSLPVQFRARFQELLVRHEARLRPSERDNVLSNGYRRWYNYFIVPLLEPESPLDAAAAAAANPNRPLCIGNFLFWIFGFQCFVVWMFVSYFPQLCDRTALGLLCLLTLYFFFVVVPMPSRRQPQTTQNQ